MPEWFRTLGFITLSVIMVVSILFMVVIVIAVYKSCRNELKRRKE